LGEEVTIISGPAALGRKKDPPERQKKGRERVGGERGGRGRQDRVTRGGEVVLFTWERRGDFRREKGKKTSIAVEEIIEKRGKGRRRDSCDLLICRKRTFRYDGGKKHADLEEFEWGEEIGRAHVLRGGCYF